MGQPFSSQQQGNSEGQYVPVQHPQQVDFSRQRQLEGSEGQQQPRGSQDQQEQRGLQGHQHKQSFPSQQSPSHPKGSQGQQQQQQKGFRAQKQRKSKQSSQVKQKPWGLQSHQLQRDHGQGQPQQGIQKDSPVPHVQHFGQPQISPQLSQQQPTSSRPSLVEGKIHSIFNYSYLNNQIGVKSN